MTPEPQQSSALAAASKRRALLALCFCIAIVEGYDLQAAAIAAPQLRSELSIAPQVLGLIFSAGTFGLLIGAALGGRMSDRFGRKPALLVSVFAFGLFSLAAGSVQSAEQLLACRLLVGVGMGGALPNLIAISAESGPPERRARAVAIVIAGLSVGGAVVSLLGLVTSSPGGWRFLFFLGGAAPLLLCLPLARLRLERDLVRTTAAAAPTGMASALFAERRLVGTLLLWAASFLVLVSVYLLANWLPTLLLERGLNRSDALWVQVAFNLAGVLGGVASGWLLDRPTLRTAGILGLYAVYLASLYILARTAPEFLVLLLAGALVGAATTAVSAVQYALAPALYPESVRGTGVGMAVAIGRIGSVAGPLLAGALLGAGYSGGDVLTAMVPIAGLAAIAAAILSRRV